MNAYETTKLIIQAARNGGPLPLLSPREKELNQKSFRSLLEEQITQLSRTTCPKKIGVLERRIQGTKEVLVRLHEA